MAYDADKHDLGLLGQDGETTIGLMLARDSKGRLLYTEHDDPDLEQQVITGVPDYSHLPPHKEFQIGQTDWRAGMGQEFYDKSEDKKYWDAINCDLRSKGRALPGPLKVVIASPNTSITCHADFNGEHYVGDGDILAKLNAEGDAFETVHDFADSESITCLKVFENNLFIARGSDNFYSYMNAAEDVTTPDNPADAKAEFFEVVDDVLWKAVLPNELKQAIDPLDEGEWSNVTTVGSTTDDILQLMTESGQLFIRKEDTTYYIDTEGNSHQLIPEMISMPSSSSFGGDVWQAKLYIPCGTNGQGLVEYDSGAVSWRSPSKSCPGNTGYTSVYQITHDEEYLFAAVSPIGDTDPLITNILAGRPETIDNESRWAWHPIAQITYGSASACTHIWTSSVFARRLYVSNPLGIYYFSLPRDYANIPEDTNYAFADGGYFITPWHHANFRSDAKAFIELALDLERMSDDAYVTAYYQVWEDTHASDWTEIGAYTTANGSEYLPVNAGSTNTGDNPSSILIRFMFPFTVPADTNDTAVLLNYDCRGIWYPTKRKIIQCSVYCADNKQLKTGEKDTQTASDIKTAIIEANAATWPVTFYDLDGDTFYAKILKAEMGIAEDIRGKYREYVYNLTLQVVPLPEEEEEEEGPVF